MIIIYHCFLGITILQVLLTGFCLTFSTPLCCAIFPQKSTIEFQELEPSLQQEVGAKYPGVTKFYYNKGL